MRVRVLGAHNLETGTARHTCFLVDDRITVDAGSLMTGLTPAEQRGIRAVLLTHRHFDHVRDLPSFALANLDSNGVVSVYALQETLDAITSRLMDGVLYPDFTRSLTSNGPKYRFQPVTSGETLDVEGYIVRPVSVPHEAPTVGYIVRGPQGGTFAYSGDIGGRVLPFLQDPMAPDPLLIEVTFPNGLEERARLTGHLTPNLLRAELTEAIGRGLAIPRIVIVHRDPRHEDDIVRELGEVTSGLGIEFTVAQEGMTLEV